MFELFPFGSTTSFKILANFLSDDDMVHENDLDTYRERWGRCLFVLRLNVHFKRFLVMSGRSHCFLGITSTFRE